MSTRSKHIILLCAITVIFCFADETAKQTHRSYSKTRYRTYSGVAVKNSNKQKIKKTLLGATPKIDSLIKVSTTMQSVTKQNELPPAGESRSTLLMITASFLLAALFTTGGIYGWQFRKQIFQKINSTISKPVTTPRMLAPQLQMEFDIPEKTTSREEKIKDQTIESNFENENRETETLVETFQTSPQHVELEMLMNGDAKISKVRSLNGFSINSLKKQIAVAKKLQTGVGEIMLRQKLSMMERRTKKETNND